jgi:hypothetical protein
LSSAGRVSPSTLFNEEKIMKVIKLTNCKYKVSHVGWDTTEEKATFYINFLPTTWEHFKLSPESNGEYHLTSRINETNLDINNDEFTFASYQVWDLEELSNVSSIDIVTGASGIIETIEDSTVNEATRRLAVDFEIEAHVTEIEKIIQEILQDKIRKETILKKEEAEKASRRMFLKNIFDNHSEIYCEGRIEQGRVKV